MGRVRPPPTGRKKNCKENAYEVLIFYIILPEVWLIDPFIVIKLWDSSRKVCQEFLEKLRLRLSNEKILFQFFSPISSLTGASIVSYYLFQVKGMDD